MELSEAVESLRLKFTSGNIHPVTRATILREEWESIIPIIEDHFAKNEKYDVVSESIKNRKETKRCLKSSVVRKLFCRFESCRC